MAARQVRRMSLEELVGQLFVVPVYGPAADAPDKRNEEAYGVSTPAEVVRRFHPGGIVYFRWTDSLRDPRQIAGLSNGLQRAALGSGARVPLLVATDQEYGAVTRIGPPATQFPGAMALGASRRPDLAREAAAIGGTELRAMGVNWDFAPDADVNANPGNPVIGVRSFSSDPRLAAAMTAAQVEGYQRGAGIAAAVKHFPGHGDTAVDSHTGVPVVGHEAKEWSELDAPPFAAAVEAGVDAVMTGHLVVPALDPSRTPATLSRPLLTGVLRGRLGFTGVVVTDSLRMAGVREGYGDDRIPVLALRAGVDVLLMPADLAAAQRALLAAVHSGELDRAVLERAAERVLRLKARRGVIEEPLVDEARVGQTVGTEAHLARAASIADRTTTVVRNPDGLLPLRDRPASLLVVGTGGGAGAADGAGAVGTAPGTGAEELAAEARARGVDARVLGVGAAPSREAVEGAVRAAGDVDAVVVLTCKAYRKENAAQVELVRRVAGAARKLVVAAADVPYDLGAVAEEAGTGRAALLATYSTSGVAMGALARVVFGEVRPVGRLPVSGVAGFKLGTGVSW
ncbi:hypothetical protein BIV57_15000 [Mangrovactinospora gilvigrisea]|uniref:beta-N-acetylhexosaminidase n=2 Tax=Mangrovactinospora gilvigrisea TaxID=1428644 RepID=A0A1J7C568_9ACTN|nr:hypothetical protein BIV57_15000 [Mangrovactinospora gilvigrisea]